MHSSKITSAVHAHQVAVQGADRWAGYASHSSASRFPRILPVSPGWTDNAATAGDAIPWLYRPTVLLLGIPHYNSLRPLVVVIGAADQIGDKANQRDQQRRVGCKNKKRVHEIAHATTNATANGNTTHQKNISIPVISISRRINPGQS